VEVTHIKRVVFVIVHEGRLALCRFSKAVPSAEAPRGATAMTAAAQNFMYLGTPSVRRDAAETWTYNFIPVAPLQWVRTTVPRKTDEFPMLASGSTLFPRIRRHLEDEGFQLSFTDLGGRQLDPPPSSTLY